MAKKKRVYHDPTTCPYCGKEFKSKQGWLGHLRWNLCPGLKEAPPPGAGPYHPIGKVPLAAVKKPTVGELKEEVERLELEDRLARLRTIRQPPQPPDLMSQAGLGPLSGEAQQIAQKRALGIDGQPAESWFISLLKTPGGLDNLVKAAKGILGVPSPGQGNSPSGASAIAEVLNLLGYGSLKELYAAQNQPKGPDGLKIAGVSLGGINLTEGVLTALISRETQLAEMENRRENQGKMMDGLASVAKALRESDFVGKVRAVWKGNSITAKPKENPPEEPVPLVCPDCGAKSSYLPSQAPPGTVIRCSNANCDFEGWEVKDEGQILAEEKAKAKAAQEAAKANAGKEQVTINCPTCGQALDATGRAIGSQVKCPICGAEADIISETEPVVPAEVEAAK